MLRSLNTLLKYDVITSDDEDCNIEDVFLDEKTWMAAYLVAKTGSWLSGRMVLLSPKQVQTFRDGDRRLQLSASSSQVKDSPEMVTELPIAREAELLLAKYWEWEPRDTKGPLPPETAQSIRSEAPAESKAKFENATDSHQRSFNEVKGYDIHAKDGEIGHLEDLFFDDEWQVSYAVIDTRNWLPGKHVILPIQEVREFRWSDTSLHMDTSRERIKNAPRHRADETITPSEEAAVKEYFKL